MKTSRVKRILDWRGSASFGVVLVVSLMLSWWSLYTLAVEFYGLPKWLAAGVSIAFDGAALFVADLASKYARSEDSGLATKLATYVFVVASVYLNIEHAILLGFGTPGIVLLGSPPVASAILFELYLRFVHRNEMRSQGLVAKRMPVFGKLAWIMFPGQTLKGFRNVIFYRLNETVTEVTGESLSRKKDKQKKELSPKVTVKGDSPVTDKINVTKMSDTVIEDSDIQVTKSSDTVVTNVPEVTVKSDTVTKPVTKVSPVLMNSDKVTDDMNSDMSVSLLVKKLWAKGVTDRVTIRKTIEDIKGTTVPANTINKAVSRLDSVPGK